MRTLAGALAGAVVVASLAGCNGAERKDATASMSTSTTTAPASTTTVAPTTTTAAKKPAPRGLSGFASCRSLLRHVKREAGRLVTPYGLQQVGGAGGPVAVVNAMATAGPATATAGGGDTVAVGDGAAMASLPNEVSGPSRAGTDYSVTNVQEDGVDEPDSVKTDGQRLVALENDRLQIIDVHREAPATLATVPLAREDGFTELLLAGNRVVLFGWSYVSASVGPMPSQPVSPTSIVKVLDISDPVHPEPAGELRMRGEYVSARLSAGVIRIVVSSSPRGPAMTAPTQSGPDQEAAALVANRAAVARSTLNDWLPTYTLARPGQPAVTAPLAPCASVLRPQSFSGLSTVSVLTIDPADLQPAHPACVLGGGHTVYASTDNLYVATQRWAAMSRPAVPAPAPGVVDDRARSSAIAVPTTRPAAPVGQTEIHQFAIPGREPATYVASGTVDGNILNQFSLSEYQGRLRVATTITRPNTGDTESVITVLEPQDGRLVPIGRVGHLGHDRERIQSVRFVGPLGYVVTFLQTDPLYVIDLHDPRHPAARGELEMPGFSSYLHPLSDTVLLGVGTGPGDTGGRGLQLSLFDVADPAHPRRIANQVFENAGSDAEQDHRALLWWAPTGQLVLPVHEWSPDAPFVGALVVPVDLHNGFGPAQRLTHTPHVDNHTIWPGIIQRAVVVGPRLLTVSPVGVQTNDLKTLADAAWLPWS